MTVVTARWIIRSSQLGAAVADISHNGIQSPSTAGYVVGGVAIPIREAVVLHLHELEEEIILCRRKECVNRDGWQEGD